MLFNSIDEVVFTAVLDPYYISHISNACLKVYGYPASDFLKNEYLWVEVIMPEDRHLIDSISAKLQKGESLHEQYRIIHKDGSLRWIETNVTPTLDENGKLVRFDGLNRDITEKKNAEEALLNSEKKFRALIENNKEVLSLSDADRKITYVSPSIKTVLGFDPEELIGVDSSTLMHPDEVAEAQAMRASLQQGTGAYGTKMLRLRHKDGSWRWVEMTGTNKLADPAINAMVTNFRDVTEKKNAEEALLNNEKRFRALIENSEDGIVLTDNDHNVIYFSPSVREILGYTPEELIGTKAYDLFHKDELEKNMQQIIALKNGQIPHITFLIRARHKDGSWRWLQSFMSNHLNDPAIKALVTNFRDVTEQKNAEEALSNSENKFRGLIENSKDGIGLTDLSQRFIYLSPSVKTILGYEPDELVGTNAFERYHPDDMELMKKLAMFIRHRSGASDTALVRILHKDSKWRWIELTATNQLDNPAIKAVVTNFRDVSDKKHAEEALLNSEKRFRALIENNKDGIALTDSNRLFIYLSPSIKVILGYEPEELIGTKATDLYHPDDQPGMRELVQSLLEKQKSFASNLLRIRHKNGEWRWIELIATNQLHEPSIQAIVTNFRDVTERKKAENELEQLNQSLEKKVHERTLQLEESNKALESFSYLVAHDLQAPLRALSGYASILKQDYRGLLGDDGTSLLDTIVQQTKHMTQLISDLLTFSRVSHTVLKQENVDLDDMVSSLSDQLCLSYSGNTIAEVKLHALGYCSCDAGLIRQVWSNLISNALKYSSKKPNPIVEIGRIKAEGETIYFVKDNGAGFDMRNAPRLFQVFQRLHTTGDFEGTGVGLALVKTIVSRHGGRVWTEAEVNKGATFYFSIPD